MPKQGWAKENEWTDPANDISCALYKSGDKGAIIWVGTAARGYFGIIAGEWENVKMFWDNLRGVFYFPLMDWVGTGTSNAFMETIEWIRENGISENAVFSIQWSFASILTGTTGKKSVADDKEVDALEGTWENDPSFIPKPPDYILHGEGDMYGVNTLRVPGAINGRRVDVEWFPLIGMDELKWYLKTYRDNYGCKIDYLIFSADELYNAYYFDQKFSATTGKIGMGDYIWDESRRLTTPANLRPSEEDGKHVFNFGDDRSAVVLDPDTNAVYLQTDNGQLSMDGCAVFYVNEDGRFTGFNFTPSSSAPAINEVLALVLTEEGELVSVWLAEGTYEEIARTAERAGIIAFNTNDGNAVGGDNSFEAVFTSSNSYVKVIKVNHDQLI
jgi:hypothetical protein